MADDWKPMLVGKVTPLPVVAKDAAPQVIVMPADPAPKPKAWRFVPTRDDNHFIIEIIATPIY